MSGAEPQRPRWVPLDPTTLSADPFEQFDLWFVDATAVVREPEAICVATVDRGGQPRARMVLLRNRDERGFGFFTNYDSQKGQDLADNEKAALLWYVEPLGRQVRIEGTTEMMSASESDAYFDSRPRGHQLGAHASHQSQPISDRATLERAVEEVSTRFEGAEVPRPPRWGGYRVLPTRFEFWQHREDRLHDRVIYAPSPTGGWTRSRLQP